MIRGYRAWDKAGKEYRYGVLPSPIPSRTMDACKDSPCSEYYNMVEIYEDVELEQFTGLYDKNGVEIYEGDIVRYKPRHSKQEIRGVVDYSTNFASYEIFTLPNKLVKGRAIIMTLMDDDRLEVVGNIHERKGEKG